MKRFVLMVVCGVVAIGVVALITGTADAAFATYTNYHSSTALVCSDCHAMHGSLQHDYLGGTSGYPKTYAGTRLIKDANVSALCLSCHDGAAASYPDVKGATSAGSPRSAGAIPTGATTYLNYMGHEVEQSNVTPPGSSTPISTFKCTSCHAQHGSNNFRNLVSAPGTGSGLNVVAKLLDAAANASFGTASADVLIAGYATRPAYTTDFYSASKIYHVNNGAATANAYAKWCEGCHTGFEVTTSGGGKHPTGLGLGSLGTTDAQFLAADNKVPVLASTLDASGVPATGMQPTCASCHKAHGNQNAFGLLQMASQTGGAQTLTEEGNASGSLTNTCQVCHNQSGAN